MAFAGRDYERYQQRPVADRRHTDGGAHHELYLMCEDVHATVEKLGGNGVEFTREISDTGFGLMTALRLPGGSELALYEPRHPSPLARSG